MFDVFSEVKMDLAHQTARVGELETELKVSVSVCVCVCVCVCMCA